MATTPLHLHRRRGGLLGIADGCVGAAPDASQRRSTTRTIANRRTGSTPRRSTTRRRRSPTTGTRTRRGRSTMRPRRCRPGWLEDEPLLVPDPAAEAPDDWDDEEDGEWEAPVWMRRPFDVTRRWRHRDCPHAVAASMAYEFEHTATPSPRDASRRWRREAAHRRAARRVDGA